MNVPIPHRSSSGFSLFFSGLIGRGKFEVSLRGKLTLFCAPSSSWFICPESNAFVCFEICCDICSLRFNC